MKNFALTVVFAALVFPGLLKAQEGFKFGVKGGLNMANIINTDLVNNKSKLGFHVGPTLHYGFGDEGRFGIGLDVLYSQKGNKVADKSEALNYIDFPLYFRYRFGFGLYLETGVDLALLMSAKYDGNSEFDSMDSNGKPIKEKYKDNLNSTDLGYLIGLGYIHRSGLGIGYRYELGLSNIIKSKAETASISLNTVGQISLMYYFKWSDGGHGHGHHRGHHRR